MADDRTEGEIQDATVNGLRQLGFGVWITSQAKRTQATPGIADLFVTGRGVCAWVEMKAAWGKQEPEQAKFQAAVEANGGHYLLAKNEMDVILWFMSLAPNPSTV